MSDEPHPIAEGIARSRKAAGAWISVRLPYAGLGTLTGVLFMATLAIALAYLPQPPDAYGRGTLRAGADQRFGRPADRDGDTVPDRLDDCPDQPGAPSAIHDRNGCPGVVVVAPGTIQILQSIRFDADRDSISPSSQPMLEIVADMLRSASFLLRVRVESHSDDRNSPEYQLDLTMRRANNVRRWLIDHGVEENRLESRGYGSSRPLAPNDTAAGRARNNRVSFIMVEDARPPQSPMGAQPLSPIAATPSDPSPPACPSTVIDGMREVIEGPDRDHDGVPNGADHCPDEGTTDGGAPGARSTRCPGCLVRDRDGDHVNDLDDRCREVRQGDHPDPKRPGCPDADADGDRVYDAYDLCDEAPPGPHPDPSRLGCPHPDPDGDGFANGIDPCPDQAPGPRPDPRRAGCPTPDADGDTVGDDGDHCPAEFGAPSQNPLQAGCPGLVEIRDGQFQLYGPVTFVPGAARFLPAGAVTLAALADAIQASPWALRVDVVVRAEPSGTGAVALRLAQHRAEFVASWLTLHHVDPARLEARGEPPVAGAAAPSPIEFRILAQPSP